ncbi:hypothetical protein POM88_011750 [Heracleum sosnowskyi]|uniref:Replication factor A C-terminal domain-containing protein n=1 Tax=Heracleum sosnowskyi TaxID=360622 RepID=A0AAD8IV42_9APIA|nr:hypothetical protein POM88_011750 [Heracleum sosnowskyi]
MGKDAIAFFTKATVVRILPNCDWYYMGCSKCNKKFPNNKVPPIPIYRVIVEVQDATSVTTFILFDRHVKKMISVSAQHILNNDKDASQETIPPILNNMLGKRYIFKLNLTSYNTIKKGEGFTVTQVEEVQATKVNNAPPQTVNLDEQVGNDNVKNSKDDLAPEDPKAFLDDVNLDEQVGNDNGKNSKDDLENKRKIPEDQNGEPQPPASSVAKAPIGKQNRNKRKK